MVKNWIQSIVGFLVLMSLVRQLIPGEKYGKYIQLTMGLVFILAAMIPLIEVIGMDTTVFQNFIQSQRQMAASESKISGTLWDMQRTFVSSYEQMIQQEIKSYFLSESAEVEECHLDIETNVNHEDYGKIYRMHILLRLKGAYSERSSVNDKIEVEEISIRGISKNQKTVSSIPNEKLNEWKKDLMLQFGVTESQLTLEIVS